MLTARMTVVGWAARSLGRETRADWRSWAGAADTIDAPPAGRTMPMMLRRRLTPLGQAAAMAACEAGADETVHYLVCSRHGEFQRTLRLLQVLADRQTLSPADFSVSVHNALAGLLSIATNATAGHAALAAGTDTFAAGLIEAAGLLGTNPALRVLLICFDEALSPPYDELATGDDAMLAVAVLLTGADRPEGETIEVVVTAAERGAQAATTAQAEAFARFLASGESQRGARGERFNLSWSRVA
jgi:Beta-ketoacyl synthase, N-terminal domain